MTNTSDKHVLMNDNNNFFFGHIREKDVLAYIYLNYYRLSSSGS